MRNYLQFDNNLMSSDRNNIYHILKNNFKNHNNNLLNLQKKLTNENNHYKILSDKINKDFLNYKNDITIDKKNLLKQYIFIINESDKKYNSKKNSIYNKLTEHYYSTKKFIHIVKNIYDYIKKLFQIKYYIHKLIHSKIKNNNINLHKKNFKNAIKKIIFYNKLLNNIHIQNHNNNSHNLEDLQKKINNLFNIINKNDLLLVNLKNNINNSSNKNELKILNNFYNNSIQNKKIFGGKLKQYFKKLNDITILIDKNNIYFNDIEKSNELLKNINSLSVENQNTSLKKIKNLFKNLFHISITLTSPQKIKNLLHKLKSLKY